MKVLITGGTGSVGMAAVRRLVEKGHDVRVIGRREGLVIEGGEYRSCDIDDYAALREQVKGMEGVVHLAGIPGPSGGSSEAIFRANCQGTFNVYQAATAEGIKRVVSASSINGFGYNFGTKAFPLEYFPIDEEHPPQTTDPYSFSKQIVEETGAYFWRREGISGVSLRLPWVYSLEDGAKERVEMRLKNVRDLFTTFLELPEEEQREKVKQWKGVIAETREKRLCEQRGHRKQMQKRPEEFSVRFGVNNFWTSIDARDSAQVIEQGLIVDYEGSHVLFVNDSRNVAVANSEKLLQAFYPEVTGRKKGIEGAETMVSIDRARQLLGFEPEFSLG